MNSVIQLYDGKVIWKNGIPEKAEEQARQGTDCSGCDVAGGRGNTIARRIIREHLTGPDTAGGKLSLKFDALASHDITYVGIIQTARASGLKEFPCRTCSRTATILSAR